MPNSRMLPAVEDGMVTMSQWLKHDMKRYVEVLNYMSEMEATIRVLSIVLEAVEGLSDIQIKLQPSLPNYTIFTDFLIYLERSESPVLIIEVKKHNTNALFGDNDSTAQVLREAHIALQDPKCERQRLPFILTNGEIWSLGIAEKVTNKIKVTECYKALILYKEELTDSDAGPMHSLLVKLKELVSIP